MPTTQQSMFPTRAQQLGIKPKVLLSRTRKSLAYHRNALAKLGRSYPDIDNSIEAALQDLLAAFDAFQAHVEASAEWLNEEAGS